jgi:hypothetical protein
MDDPSLPAWSRISQWGISFERWATSGRRAPAPVR